MIKLKKNLAKGFFGLVRILEKSVSTYLNKLQDLGFNSFSSVLNQFVDLKSYFPYFIKVIPQFY